MMPTLAPPLDGKGEEHLVACHLPQAQNASEATHAA
jgi:hypothetical protein